jgi:hypothetical protein
MKVPMKEMKLHKYKILDRKYCCNFLINFLIIIFIFQII